MSSPAPDFAEPKPTGTTSCDASATPFAAVEITVSCLTLKSSITSIFCHSKVLMAEGFPPLSAFRPTCSTAMRPRRLDAGVAILRGSHVELRTLVPADRPAVDVRVGSR
ncbi:hypothetical protein EJB05_41280 [Eragrostis curvula]|uniref:Uncharacterized protein n=1 Tax=Eragrostis curvula TaxID=38414 RepID=A0A5J9TBC0_9POAL|nr:hypothetical protein EJB05_41256 [Eragrostis curvula]TVU07903.1 hypothetical protein EJB05_41280 [Eragrostis curvula]